MVVAGGGGMSDRAATHQSGDAMDEEIISRSGSYSQHIDGADDEDMNELSTGGVMVVT